jgi:hypothetical protein
VKKTEAAKLVLSLWQGKTFAWTLMEAFDEQIAGCMRPELTRALLDGIGGPRQR